jgi:saccharopine dehydrogenase-like NADP-dependent oxidoreductase
MKNILILGAGQSTPYLISYLLDQAAEHDWFVMVADRDEDLAAQRVNGHPRGHSTAFELDDMTLRATLIRKADLVMNLLPAQFQPVIAQDCVEHGAHMVSASYRNARIRALDADAHRADVLLLSEVGLDPGIDLMSATEIIRRIRNNGGYVEEFISYGSGVPAPEVETNPLRYCITWNPRNVVMSADHGAQYLVNNQIKIVPWHNVFNHSWPVEVDGVGPMEAYPNRDSLSYVTVFGLQRCATMIRGTLRYPGWSETWLQIVRLGLPNEHMRIPDLKQRTWAEIVEMFLPRAASGSRLEGRVATFLNISATGRIMENLRWLGLFSDEPTGCTGETAAEAMTHLLQQKLPLPPQARDMVAIVHELVACYPEQNNRREKIVSTFKDFGEPDGVTAMARTVGLPAAIAGKLIMTGALPLTGSHIPTHESVYGPVLRELESEGLRFEERVEPLD